MDIKDVTWFIYILFLEHLIMWCLSSVGWLGCIDNMWVCDKLVIYTWLGWYTMVSLDYGEYKGITYGMKDVAAIDDVEWFSE